MKEALKDYDGEWGDQYSGVNEADGIVQDAENKMEKDRILYLCLSLHENRI